jgi:hypothetical protein
MACLNAKPLFCRFGCRAEKKRRFPELYRCLVYFIVLAKFTCDTFGCLFSLFKCCCCCCCCCSSAAVAVAVAYVLLLLVVVVVVVVVLSFLLVVVVVAVVAVFVVMCRILVSAVKVCQVVLRIT